MRRCAVLVIVLMLAMNASAAFAESGTSEIEKVLGLVSWLIGSAVEAKEEAHEEADAFSEMMWMYNENNPALPDDVPEIAALLKALGIEGITDEHISEMIDAAKDAQVHGYVCSREIVALHLLSAVGMGTYDDDFVLNPSSDTVFALDMELFGSEGLYSDFFGGLNAICRGEFVFSDLDEDYGKADLVEGVGVIGLSFLVNGEPHTVNAMMMQDWFDMEVFNAVAEIAVHPESGKRLYAMYDGMQGLIIFYNTPEWARQFEEKTACPLSAQM